MFAQVCASLTPGWLVCVCVVECVVADETMKQLHRHRIPPELHSVAGYLVHLQCRTSRGRCTHREGRAGWTIVSLVCYEVLFHIN